MSRHRKPVGPPPPNPAWRYSPPRSGAILVDRFAPDGTFLRTERVAVVEVDACAIASLLPPAEVRR